MTQASSGGEGGPRAAQIARHPVNLPTVEKRIAGLARLLPKVVAAARRDLVHCNGLKIDAREQAAYLLLWCPESPEACGALRLGAEAVVAIFQGAMAPDEEIEVRLGDEPPARLPSNVSPDLHDGSNWMDGFFMAAVCRDDELLNSLCAVPSRIFRESTTRGPEYAYQFAEALQSYWKKEDSVAVRARSAADAAKDENLGFPATDATRDLARPAIEVFGRLIDGGAEAFNESLSRALELHRRFWSRSEDMARDPKGYFSLSLTGLACLANDAGIAVTVESDYLPKSLVRGDCRGSA
jgi:hypothetical protein